MLLVAYPAMAPSFLRKRYSAVCWPCSNSLASSAATAARSSGWTHERQEIGILRIFVGAVAEHALDVLADEGGGKIAGRGEDCRPRPGRFRTTALCGLLARVFSVLGGLALRNIAP